MICKFKTENWQNICWEISRIRPAYPFRRCNFWKAPSKFRPVSQQVVYTLVNEPRFHSCLYSSDFLLKYQGNQSFLSKHYNIYQANLHFQPKLVQSARITNLVQIQEFLYLPSLSKSSALAHKISRSELLLLSHLRNCWTNKVRTIACTYIHTNNQNVRKDLSFRKKHVCTKHITKVKVTLGIIKTAFFCHWRGKPLENHHQNQH